MLFPKRKNTLSGRSWEASSFRFLFSVCSFGAFIRCLICSSSFQGRFLAYLVAVAVVLLVAVLVPLPEGDPTHLEVLTRQAVRTVPVAGEVLEVEALVDDSKERSLVNRFMNKKDSAHIMKKWLALIVVLLGSLSLSAGIYNPNTIPIPENGEHPSYISNPDNILSDSICDVVNRKLYRLEDSTGVKTLVMVMEHIEGDDPQQFSLQVGNIYGIGSKEENTGLILTLATLDRSYCIMPGRGLEGDMPDITCYRIGENVMVPRLKESAWDKAIDETVDAVSALLLKDTVTVQRMITSSEPPQEDSIFRLILGAIVGGPLIFWAFFRLIFFIPNLICNLFISYKEKEWNLSRGMRMFWHCFNWFWNIKISLYYKEKSTGEKIFYVDNRKYSFTSARKSGGSRHSSSGSRRSYSSRSYSSSRSSSSRSHGSRGGGSFSGGGSGGRF